MSKMPKDAYGVKIKPISEQLVKECAKDLNKMLIKQALDYHLWNLTPAKIIYIPKVDL